MNQLAPKTKKNVFGRVLIQIDPDPMVRAKPLTAFEKLQNKLPTNTQIAVIVIVIVVVGLFVYFKRKK